MAQFDYTGWRTVVIKQHFTIEADSKEEADSKLWELQNDMELDSQWFDLSTAKIKGSDEDPDFYDDEDELVEAAE